MEMTRVVRPDLMSDSTNDKTTVADVGMEMTVAIPSKKFAQNTTEVDASSDSDSTSQGLEVTRASLFSHRSTDVTHDVIESLIAADNGKELKKPTSDETIAGLDEGMEMTAGIHPVVDTPVLPEQTRSLMENVAEDNSDEDDDEVTFNAASMLANCKSSGTSSGNVHCEESGSNEEDEEDGVFKDPMEITKGITKDFRMKLAERSKSNSSGGSPDDDSILPESFLESGDTENDSVFLHSSKPIHGTGRTNPESSSPPGITGAPKKASSFEELLNPTSVDFSCVPGYQG